MAIPAPSDTLHALGNGLLPHCTSRALFATRFSDPTSKETARKNWFLAMMKPRAESPAPSTAWLPASAVVIHARLMARMMVNLAGGTMENANVLLDWRGFPFIPGSAVKGCARRMALQALHDWPQDGIQDDDDPTKPCRVGFQNKAQMLATIARVFGWVETDWAIGKNKDKKTGQDTTWESDFAWACHGEKAVLDAARESVGTSNAFAGSVAFLDARPSSDPGLELDVVTPHHTKYYEGKLSTATDTEEPVPVYFPAVKAQGPDHYFTFPLIPLSRSDAALLQFATTTLRAGLEIFGVGAKTNAGYGWFDAGDSIQAKVREKIEARKSREQKEEAERQAEATRLAELEARRLERLAAEEQTAGMTPEQVEDWKVSRVSDEQLMGKLSSFANLPKPEQQAIVRALRDQRVGVWQVFKQKAQKGKPAQMADAIRAVSKELNFGKMP